MTAAPRAGRVRDMTEGSPFRLILSFAVPLFIGNIFQQIYSMVDTMVVGHHLGDSAIAAIGATSSLYYLLINFAGGLNIGYSIIVTQRFGAREPKELKQAIAGMILLDAAAAVILTALSLTFMKPLMRFMNTPEDIFSQAYSYIAVICCGIAATLGYNMFASILRAMGNSRSPLYFLIGSSLLNILLDILFVTVFEMGLGGAAFATVIAQAASAIACGAYVLRYYREYMPGKEDFRVPGKMLGELFSTGIAMAMMSCVVELGSVIFQRANNLLGASYITAYTAGRRLMMIFVQPKGSISAALATFVGQNWGGRKPLRIRRAMKQACLMELGWGLFSSAVIYLFGRALIRFTTGTSDPEVLDNAVLSLRIHFSTFPVLGVLFCLRHALQSMGQKLAPVLSSCIELAMKILAAGLLIPRLGFVGTCVTEPVTWILMTLFLSAVYLTGRKKLFASLEKA